MRMKIKSIPPEFTFRPALTWPLTASVSLEPKPGVLASKHLRGFYQSEINSNRLIGEIYASIKLMYPPEGARAHLFEVSALEKR